MSKRLVRFIVKDFSRFGRNAIESGYFIERVFPLYRVRFIAVDDGYDSDSGGDGSCGMEVAFKFLIKDLMSMDELAVMDGSMCILQLRGVRPFLSKKYDITKHPMYKQLADYDKRNEFDIQKHLSTKLAVRADDVFEVFSLNPLVPPDTAA